MRSRAHDEMEQLLNWFSNWGLQREKHVDVVLIFDFSFFRSLFLTLFVKCECHHIFRQLCSVNLRKISCGISTSLLKTRVAVAWRLLDYMHSNWIHLQPFPPNPLFEKHLIFLDTIQKISFLNIHPKIGLNLLDIAKNHRYLVDFPLAEI